MYIFHKILVIAVLLQIITNITSTSIALRQDISHELASDNSNLTNTNVATNNGTNFSKFDNKRNNTSLVKDQQTILTEGGGKVTPAAVGAAVIVAHESTVPVSLPNGHNRENAVNEADHLLKSIINNNTVKTSLTSNITGRPALNISTSSSSVAPLSMPDIEKQFILINRTSDHKKISARKGVNFTYIEDNIKKPLVLTASEDEPYAPSHFQSRKNSTAPQSIPKVPNIEMLTSSNGDQNSQKYVVPIVIVILSVPFVAILISVLYKRGAEWWKYRHYRRMDFLINGMYDN